MATVATLVKPLTQPPYSEYEDTAKLNRQCGDKKRTSVGMLVGLEKRREEKRIFYSNLQLQSSFHGF